MTVHTRGGRATGMDQLFSLEQVRTHPIHIYVTFNESTRGHYKFHLMMMMIIIIIIIITIIIIIGATGTTFNEITRTL